MANTLYKACKSTLKDGKSGTHPVGDYDIYIEYYTQDDIDTDVEKIAYNEISACDFGDDNEENVVLVASENITIPEGFTLTPTHPKKSMVILCRNFVNNGTISMTGKAPNVLPHSWYIVGKTDGYSQNVIIAPYADNAVITTGTYSCGNTYYNNGGKRSGIDGTDGTNRNCGSGGTGMMCSNNSTAGSLSFGNTGSGYAFGGGAGSGGIATTGYSYNSKINVDTTYPMRGGNGTVYSGSNGSWGGVGNPGGQGAGSLASGVQNVGCGGRLIIFCESFENNGTISANGINSSTASLTVWRSTGGASGGGAIDIFYSTEVNLNSDAITADGGIGGTCDGAKAGNGGKGCITLSNGISAPIWTMQDIFKPMEKYMSKENMTYFLGELVKRVNEFYL